MVLLGQTMGLRHNHPCRQPGQKGIMHTPTYMCAAPLLTWDEILLFGCGEKKHISPLSTQTPGWDRAKDSGATGHL